MIFQESIVGGDIVPQGIFYETWKEKVIHCNGRLHMIFIEYSLMAGDLVGEEYKILTHTNIQGQRMECNKM